MIISRRVWEEICCETRDERELAGRLAVVDRLAERVEHVAQLAELAEHAVQLAEHVEHVAQLAKRAYGGDAQHLPVGGVELLGISPLLEQLEHASPLVGVRPHGLILFKQQVRVFWLQQPGLVYGVKLIRAFPLKFHSRYVQLSYCGKFGAFLSRRFCPSTEHQ